jgi:hypothetical protein
MWMAIAVRVRKVFVFYIVANVVYRPLLHCVFADAFDAPTRLDAWAVTDESGPRPSFITRASLLSVSAIDLDERSPPDHMSLGSSAHRDGVLWTTALQPADSRALGDAIDTGGRPAIRSMRLSATLV